MKDKCDCNNSVNPSNSNDLLIKPRKFSDILLDQINGKFFENIFDEDDDFPSHHHCSTFKKDVNELILFSKEFQRDFEKNNNNIVDMVENHSSKTSKKGGQAAAVFNHSNWQTTLPPFSFQSTDETEDYVKELVDIVWNIENTPVVNVPPIQEVNKLSKTANELKIIKKESKNSTKNSNKYDSEKRNPTSGVKNTVKPTPRKHNCLGNLESSSAIKIYSSRMVKRPAPQRAIKSARNYADRYYDFNSLHPDLELVPSETVFPKRIIKQAVQENPVPNPLSSISVARSPVKSDKPHSVHPSAVLDLESNPTWHEMLENPQSINQTKVETNSKRPIQYKSMSHNLKSTQTSPQEENKKNLHMGFKCEIQNLEPLVIQPECKVQNLPNVAIIAEHSEYKNPHKGPNNKYFEIMHTSPTALLASVEEQHQLPQSDYQQLPSEINQDSFEPSERNNLTNLPSESSESTIIPPNSDKDQSYSSFEESNIIQGTTTTSNSSVTDDEKSFILENSRKRSNGNLSLETSKNSPSKDQNSNASSILNEIYQSIEGTKVNEEKLDEHLIPKDELIKSKNQNDIERSLVFPDYFKNVLDFIDDVFEDSLEDTVQFTALSENFININQNEWSNKFDCSSAKSAELMNKVDTTQSVEHMNKVVESNTANHISTISQYAQTVPQQNSMAKNFQHTSVQTAHVRDVATNTTNEMRSTAADKSKLDSPSVQEQNTTHTTDMDDFSISTENLQQTQLIFDHIRNEKMSNFRRMEEEKIVQHMPAFDEQRINNLMNCPVQDKRATKSDINSMKHAVKPIFIPEIGQPLPEKCRNGQSMFSTDTSSIAKSSVPMVNLFNNSVRSPSERYKSIKFQQYQDLIGQHPKMSKTINSIVRSSKQYANPADDLCSTFRSYHEDTSIMEAARKFLNSLKRKSQTSYGSPTTTATSSSERYSLDLLKTNSFLTTTSDSCVSHNFESKLFCTNSEDELLPSGLTNENEQSANVYNITTNNEVNSSAETQNEESCNKTHVENLVSTSSSLEQQIKEIQNREG